jgi:hypothetical protein
MGKFRKISIRLMKNDRRQKETEKTMNRKKRKKVATPGLEYRN